MYNLNAQVNYHDMFVQYLDLYEREVLDPVIEELYRCDICAVFGLQPGAPFADANLGEALLEIEPRLYAHPRFAAIMERYKDTRYCVDGRNRLWNLTTLLCYDSFYIIHRCICGIMSESGEIDDDVLDALDAYVTAQLKRK